MINDCQGADWPLSRRALIERPQVALAGPGHCRSPQVSSAATVPLAVPGSHGAGEVTCKQKAAMILRHRLGDGPSQRA